MTTSIGSARVAALVPDRRKRLIGLTAVLAVLVGMPVAEAARQVEQCTSRTTQPAFREPVYVDTQRSGGEPVLQATQDGALVLAAHAGTTLLAKDPSGAGGAGDFAAGYANQTLVWRSADGGRSWRYNGLAGLGAGPHSVASSGFSDPDLTIDAAGRVYGTEINLANISVYSSVDGGQTWPDSNPLAWVGDRPWITATGPGIVYLYIQNPLALFRSSDAGRSWKKVSDDPLAAGKLHVDPLRPEDGLIAPLRGGGAAISADGGTTWEPYPLRLGRNTSAFAVVAVDQAGTVYAAHAGGYTGPGDNRPDGEVTLAALDRETGQWSAVDRLNTPPGDDLWPWLAAGRAGQVALVWLHRPTGTNEFYVYAALSSPIGRGCPASASGLTWRITNASKRPVHIGDICAGTNCNLDVTTGGDRRLGDFLSATFRRDGKLVIASGDTRLLSPIGGPKPVSNPIVIVQR